MIQKVSSTNIIAICCNLGGLPYMEIGTWVVVPCECECSRLKGWGVKAATFQPSGVEELHVLLLLLFKSILHHIASYNASKFGACVTKGDVSNESTSRELWSSPLNFSVPIYNKNRNKREKEEIKSNNRRSGKLSPNAEKIGHPKN